MTSESNRPDRIGDLPPLCYLRHPVTGATVAIRRGEFHYFPVDTRCSPEFLNARLPRPPTEVEIAAMKHGSLVGWDTPGADPAVWKRHREGGTP